MLLASHRRENDMTSLLFHFFVVLLCRGGFLMIIAFLKMEAQKRLGIFLPLFGELS